MTPKLSTFAMLVLVIAGASSSASATTLSFAGLSQSGSGSTAEGNTLTQQGFIFTDLLNGVGDGFVAWQASSPNLPGLDTANTSLLEFFANSTTELTQAGNAAFTLNSIDLAQYNDLQSAGTYMVTFTGTHPDNSTVSQTLTLTRVLGTPVLQTFALINFTNVVKVDFTQGVAASGTAYQFDNVVVNAATAIPEPATFLLGAVSLAGLVAAKLRRRS
jgi:hypothetical protein